MPAAVKQERPAPACLKAAASAATESRTFDKKTLNQFDHKLKLAPQHVKQFAETVKLKKAPQDPKKFEFIKEVLEADNYNTEYFNRMRKVGHIDKEQRVNAWVSWKKLCDEKGAAVAALMVKQKKVDTRPHSELDRSDKETKAPPKEEQREYRLKTDRQLEETYDEHKITWNSEARNMCQSNLLDFKAKAAKYDQKRSPRHGVGA
ncbi:unnamed protein product, partial [Prorocentrum cordatum]